MSRVEGAIGRGVRRIAPVGAAFFLCLVASAAAVLAAPTTVTTHQTSRGKVLAAANGHALYLFTADTASKSNCIGACASVWRPLLTSSRPVAAKGSGVNAKLLGTVRRGRGLQVTYNGHPLYLFAKDKRAGQTSGEGARQFGGHWYLVNTRGNAVKSRPRGKCPPFFVSTPSGCLPESYPSSDVG
jgi:predicted lipoprotein with Yx(FWY)xxD motif